MVNDLNAKILMDEKLDVSYERVDKLDAPLLLIGLGGTGADAVRTVKETLARRFTLPTTEDGKVVPVPRRTGYLVIDSDATGKSGLDDSEILNISSGVNLSAMLRDKQHSHLSPQQKQWVHRDLHEVGQEGTIGAGTYRAASRLMLDCKFTEIYDRIHLAIRNLVTMQAGGAGMAGAAQIFVITGIGGGTGSGTFLDIGEIIRHMMSAESDLQVSYNLNAYIVMPDLTLSHLLEENAPTMMDIVKRNSYAALKELDFWMDYKRHHTRYDMTYTCGKTITWRDPFDHVTLLSGTNVEGNVFEGAYKLVQRTIAENLLHYMADEATSTNAANGVAEFTFLSYESNLHAQSQHCRGKMTLPLNHTYRAVGAYSKRIPKKKILYYEGGLLFKTFIPLRNERGIIVPNDALLTDGKANQRAAQVAGKDFGSLSKSFSSLVPFPDQMQNFKASNTALVQQLRNHAPWHTNYATWQETTVAPAARKYAQKYLDSIWANFATLCKNIMSDPAYGPFSLLQYLEDESKSLRVLLNNLASKSQSTCNNLYTSVIPAAKESCNNLYARFMKPPILNGQQAVQAYLDALQLLLIRVQQYELAKQYEQAMVLMCKRIEAYISSALKPLCNLLVELESEFGAPDNVVDSLGSDLFPVSTLHAEINQTFEAANHDGRISRSFLGKLCDSTFETTPNVDTGSCGLTFLFRQDAQLKALKLMKEEMDACFEAVNSQDLEKIMALKCANSDPAAQAAAQTRYITDLATSVVNSATPLFSLADGGSRVEIVAHTAKQLYFSVPQDATTFLAQLTPQAGGNAVTVNGVALTPKASSLTDHIYCNMTWDVLPLYSYSQMDAIKAAYDETLSNPDGGSAAPALHLVWNGDADVDYSQNWCMLPDPAPFYLFSQNGCIRDVETYDRVRALVSRALDSGMLTINSTVEHPVQFPKYTFRTFRDSAGALHNETIVARVQQILAMRDPITGAPASQQALLDALNGLLAEADRAVYSADKSPTVMKHKLGINDAVTPIDPFVVGNNPVQKRQANQNHYLLTVEYAVHILLQNPALLRDVQYQIDSFEQISAAINRFVGQAKTWAPRIAYAETFGKLFAYDFVRFDMMQNPIFKDETGSICPLIQPAIFHEDLKDCLPVIKAVGVMADMDAGHAIRKTLEFKLSVAEKRWDDDALHSALTGEQVSEQIKRLEELSAEAGRERDIYASKKMNDMHADNELMEKYLTLLNGVKMYADSRLEVLRRISLNTATESVQTAAQTVAQTAGSVSDAWDCTCGQKGLTTMFCPACGAKRPEKQQVKPAEDTWDCACGQKGLTTMFCPACGARRPQATWDCACGQKGLTTMFCPACGSKRPNT